MPSTRTTLSRAVWPLSRVTRDFGTPSDLATNLIKAVLAWPSTGGAVTRARSGSVSASPATSASRSARGVSRMARSACGMRAGWCQAGQAVRWAMASPQPVPTIYEWAGGRDAFARWLNVFYDLVERDELLAPLFGGTVSVEHREHVTDWWSEVMGGPPLYTDQHGGYERMLAHHRGLGIDP